MPEANFLCKHFNIVVPTSGTLDSCDTKRLQQLSEILCLVGYMLVRGLRSFLIRFDFEPYVRFDIRFVLMVRFEIFES